MVTAKNVAAKKVPAKVPAKKVPAKETATAATPPGPAPTPAPAKPAKLKLVRDSFTIPALEYGALAQLKQRAIRLARPAKKSELLRAGLMALAAMSDKVLIAALTAVPPIKTGRPKVKKTLP